MMAKAHVRGVLFGVLFGLACTAACVAENTATEISCFNPDAASGGVRATSLTFFGLTQTTPATGGVGVGKATFNPFSVTFPLNDASLVFFTDAQMHFSNKEECYVVVKRGTTTLQYEFKVVQLQSVDLDGVEGTSEPKVTLTFLYEAMLLKDLGAS